MENGFDNYSPNDIEFHVKTVETYFFKDKTDLYFKEIPLIENKINQEEINFSSKNENVKTKEEIMKYFKSIPIINQIYDDINLFNKCSILQNFMTNTEAESEYNGIKTWFKYEEEVKSVTICGGSIIECDLFNLFAVLSEIDMMKQFIHHYEDINKICEITPHRWIMHVKLKMPITFTNRDMVCTGYGLINKEEKTIILPFKSVDKFLDYPIPEETSSHKRVYCHYGYYHIKHLSENKYYLSCGFNVDIKIPIIPWFILNGITKKSTYYIIDGLKKQILDPKAQLIYAKRIEEKKEYYENLRKALEF